MDGSVTAGIAAARLAVVDCGRRMIADGLVVGTSGNVSARVADLIAITPTGVPYDRITPGDIGIHRLDGTAVDAPLPPTSELAMHMAVYARTDARAVVHTHSVAATAVGTLVDELPPIHYQIAMMGGPVRVAPYATYGTPELAANMAAALDGRSGCLLGNHGTITIGATLPEAYARAQYLEWLCEVWLRARSAGQPRLLDDDEIARVAEKFKHYGPGATPDPR
ncbi:MAG TPA: class II aldolase/adducin family protein [Micromonosporaceae bacterium]